MVKGDLDLNQTMPNVEFVQAIFCPQSIHNSETIFFQIFDGTSTNRAIALLIKIIKIQGQTSSNTALALCSLGAQNFCRSH